MSRLVWFDASSGEALGTQLTSALRDFRGRGERLDDQVIIVLRSNDMDSDWAQNVGTGALAIIDGSYSAAFLFAVFAALYALAEGGLLGPAGGTRRGIGRTATCSDFL